MRKRGRSNSRNLDTAIVDVWKRELGQISNRTFAHRLAASEDLVLRLELLMKLEKHRGCVNTISFSSDGDILVSGSDDRRVILWDWQFGHIKLSFHSGHNNNVFQAKLMPFSDDRTIVTCAADGQVRHAKILESGHVETKLLGKHQGRAHKLAIEPGSPHIFYTCGEDGLVQHFDLRTGAATELFNCQSVQDGPMPIVRLNAIAMDPRNPNLFAVAGSDEYTRVYDIRKYQWDGSTAFGQPADYFCPQHLIGDELVGITGLAFSDQSELLATYNDEFIYLFTKDMGLGPDPKFSSPEFMDRDADETKSAHISAGSSSDNNSNLKAAAQVYKGHRNCETVKGVNFFGPNCEYVMSGSDCGRIFIWRKKSGELIRVMEADKQVVNCIESHPHTTVLASSGIENDIKIYIPKAVERATLPTNIEKVLMPGPVHFFPFFPISDDDEEEDDLYLDFTGDEDGDSSEYDDYDDEESEGDGEEEETEEVHSCTDIEDDHEFEDYFDNKDDDCCDSDEDAHESEDYFDNNDDDCCDSDSMDEIHGDD